MNTRFPAVSASGTAIFILKGANNSCTWIARVHLVFNHTQNKTQFAIIMSKALDKCQESGGNPNM